MKQHEQNGIIFFLKKIKFQNDQMAALVDIWTASFVGSTKRVKRLLKIDFKQIDARCNREFFDYSPPLACAVYGLSKKTFVLLLRCGADFGFSDALFTEKPSLLGMMKALKFGQRKWVVRAMEKQKMSVFVFCLRAARKSRRFIFSF